MLVSILLGAIFGVIGILFALFDLAAHVVGDIEISQHPAQMTRKLGLIEHVVAERVQTVTGGLFHPATPLLHQKMGRSRDRGTGQFFAHHQGQHMVEWRFFHAGVNRR